MQSLGGILASRDVDELRSIAALWGLPPPRDVDMGSVNRLESGIRDTISARFVWEHLDEIERAVLYAILGPSARNWRPLEQLPELTKLEPAPLQATLEKLKRRRLVLEEIARVQGTELYGQRAVYFGYTFNRPANQPIENKQIVYIPTEIATVLYATGREIFSPQGSRADKTLDDILMPYRQGDLDQIGRRYGLVVQSYSSRNDVRQAMAANLCQADAVRYALGRLESGLRGLYETLMQRDGRLTLREVRRLTGLDGPTLNAALHTLEEFAIAFDTFSEGQRLLFIPRETLENLRRDAARPRVQVGLRPCDEPRSTAPANPSFLWDLAMFVASVYQQEIELTRSDGLHKRIAMKLLPTLNGPRAQARDETQALGYLEMLKQEARELGLVSIVPLAEKAAEPAKPAKGRAKANSIVEEAKGQLAPGPKLEAWAQCDLAGQARKLFRRWLTDRWWVDQLGAGYRGWLSHYIDVGAARAAIQKALRGCEPGVWYSLASLRDTIKGDDPFVLRPVQRFAGEAGFKLADQLRERWDQTDGEVIAGIVRSSLAEMGLVALGYQRETAPGLNEVINPDTFMLTELGAAALGVGTPVSEQTETPGEFPAVNSSDLSCTIPDMLKDCSSQPLIVQPNFEVLVMEPCMPVLYHLPRYAVPERIGRVSRFTLTREALLRGLAGGLALDDLLASLEQQSQKGLPQNIAYTLRDWARQYKEVRVKQVILLEVSDETLVNELANSGKLAALGLRRLGPCALAAPGETNLRDLHRALKKLGVAVKFGGGLQEPDDPDERPAPAAARKKSAVSARST
ncbi:MAG TPA: helicase-associated domain-containing protein [Ktedonobacterales bacterium]|nr:helicase-associated domain-containing protein [Ktedonobacterales bacterium]